MHGPMDVELEAVPEGRWFQELAAQHGFPAAVRWRDSGGPIPTSAELDEE